MVCAAELLNGNLLRDADFDSLFLCMAFGGSDPGNSRERDVTGFCRWLLTGFHNHRRFEATIIGKERNTSAWEGAIRTATCKPLKSVR
jgi:hypothetical protein